MANAAYPGAYQTGISCSAVIISQLSGMALDWVTSYMEHNDPTLQNSEDLVALLEWVFSEIAIVQL